MKTLVIDIETAPNIVHTWGLFKQSVSLNQLIVPGYVLCFAAKWTDSSDIVFARVKHGADGQPTLASRRAMLAEAHKLLNEADAVVHFNGTSFDVPKLNAELMELGFAPPSPFAEIDLKLAIKKRASFASNKLAYLSERLGVGSKVKHEGHSLWRKVMADDASAWKRMQRYNEGDVRLTERLYRRILPWIPNHPNRALFVDDAKPCCPHCASTLLVRRGTAQTRAQTYPRYNCKRCGAWSRGAGRLRAAVDRRPF